MIHDNPDKEANKYRGGVDMVENSYIYLPGLGIFVKYFHNIAIALLSPSVQIDDTHPSTIPKNPSNAAPVHNKDCVTQSQFLMICDIS